MWKVFFFLILLCFAAVDFVLFMLVVVLMSNEVIVKLGRALIFAKNLSPV